MEIKNICIFGTGGVGGFFGYKLAKLSEKTNNTKTFFIARGEHLLKIKNDGLILNTPDKKGSPVKPALATDNANEIPYIDLCFITVKSYDLENACKSIKDKIKEQSVIISLLNGINIYNRIRDIIKNGIILPACVYVGTHIESAGIITQKGGEGKILFGTDPLHADFKPDKITGLFDKADIKYQWFDDPDVEIWKKYVFIAGFALVTAYSKKSLGEVMENEELKQKTRTIMEEINALAIKKGVRLPESIVDDSLNKARNFPFGTKTSYQRDIELKGKLNEGDLFGASIIELGKEYNVKTPVTSEVFNKIESSL